MRDANRPRFTKGQQVFHAPTSQVVEIIDGSVIRGLSDVTDRVYCMWTEGGVTLVRPLYITDLTTIDPEASR